MSAAQAIDPKSTIVSGSDLRILLGSEHLTYGEIHAALREKGIFVGNSEKSITVPLLSATLLTPDNFTKLIESSVSRESQPKVKVAALDLMAADTDWITPLKSMFDDPVNVLDPTSSIDFSTTPTLVVHSANKAEISFQIQRKDYSKDWIQRELAFSAQVMIERQGGELKLELTSTHSSKETEQLNKKISTQVAKMLHGKNLVKQDEPLSVAFGALNNEERIRYFKRLTAGFGSSLKPGCVNDIDICLDANEPNLPDDDPQIAWMKQTVRRFNVDGERLNDIFLINDEKYYKYYYILRMNVTFPFVVLANEGDCRVTFSFSGPRTVGPTSELIFEVARLTYKESPNADAKKVISTEIQHALRSLIEEKFKLALAERAVEDGAPLKSEIEVVVAVE